MNLNLLIMRHSSLRIPVILFALIAFSSLLTAQNALDFDGTNDYVQVAGWSGVLGTTPRTIEAWVKVPSTVNSGGKPIVAWGDNGVNGAKWTFRLEGGNGRIRIECQGGHKTGTTDIRDDQWHHIAAVWENDGTPDILDALLYVDGVLESLGTSNAEPVNTTAGINVKIGGNHGTVYWDGAIDEVRIWTEARSQAQLQANMNTELCSEPNLVGYYKFNQGTAGGNNPNDTLLTDFSGQFNHGTLNQFSLNGNGSNFVNGVPLTTVGPLVSVVNQQDVQCFGDSSGSATLLASSGTAPYLYLWPSGTMGPTETGLGAGVYTVTVVDMVNCANEALITIQEPPLLTSTTFATGINCAGDTTGGLEVTAFGGTGPYTIQWGNGSQDTIQSGLPVGTYYVTVTDMAGCETEDSAVVQLLFDTLTVAIDSTINVTCQGGNDGQLWALAAGGMAPYSFVWDDPNNQPFSQANNLEEGAYSVVITDANGCTATQQGTVNFQHPTPSVNLGADIVTSMSVATITAPAGFSTYLWSTGANAQAISVINNGTYTVTVTDENGCTATDEIMVTLNITSVGPDLADLPHLSIFPNPATDQVNLVWEGAVEQLTITDLSGRVLIERSVRTMNQIELDLSAWPRGAYMIHLMPGQTAGQVKKLLLH